MSHGSQTNKPTSLTKKLDERPQPFVVNRFARTPIKKYET
jgi:hypothetical protein